MLDLSKIILYDKYNLTIDPVIYNDIILFLKK